MNPRAHRGGQDKSCRLTSGLLVGPARSVSSGAPSDIKARSTASKGIGLGPFLPSSSGDHQLSRRIPTTAEVDCIGSPKALGSLGRPGSGVLFLPLFPPPEEWLPKQKGKRFCFPFEMGRWAKLLHADCDLFRLSLFSFGNMYFENAVAIGGVDSIVPYGLRQVKGTGEFT